MASCAFTYEHYSLMNGHSTYPHRICFIRNPAKKKAMIPPTKYLVVTVVYNSSPNKSLRGILAAFWGICERLYHVNAAITAGSIHNILYSSIARQRAKKKAHTRENHIAEAAPS